ncbi:MAG: archaellin/type IV pilin N-terminal domain-containing protein [Desulfurococcaceae archaeon]
MARGIEPVIAAVILIAIAVVVAIAVIGWIMGLWGAVSTPREQLSVTGLNLTISKNENVTYLMITNSGGVAAEITSVSVSGIACTSSIEDSNKIIEPGKSMTVKVGLQGCEPIPGAMYTVIVYTKAGGAYPTVVKAVEATSTTTSGG